VRDPQRDPGCAPISGGPLGGRARQLRGKGRARRAAAGAGGQRVSEAAWEGGGGGGAPWSAAVFVFLGWRAPPEVGSGIPEPGSGISEARS
jgi:hypothetical protein